MKILSSAQIRELDQYTISNESISSIDLMERASKAFCRWFISKISIKHRVAVFAGIGNNGGDGLAIARILSHEGFEISVYVLGESGSGTPDFKKNLERIISSIEIIYLKDIEEIQNTDVIIDAIFGSGLNRPIEGFVSEVVKYINTQDALKISVDVPSGLWVDQLNGEHDIIVEADYTVTFQLPKLTFLLPESQEFVGKWEVVDIGLSRSFLEKVESNYNYISKDFIATKLKRRNKFSHKGTYGHALIIAGSYGKVGAAVLASSACLRTGVGLLTIYSPACGYSVLQSAVPEAMVLSDPSAVELTTLPDLIPYNAIGVGPGIGKSLKTKALLEQLLEHYAHPLVIDADALNILAAASPNLLDKIPGGSILTPHPKEFERLVGKTTNSLERLNVLKGFCKRYNCYVVLKGAHTVISTPDGKFFFNSTGNPGMATGGSGDVLTGVITSLLAQNYSPLEAALIGVYLHGYAGDRAALHLSEESLLPTDIIGHISSFYKDHLSKGLF